MSSVAAPYIFSRLINNLTIEKGFETIATGFALYALLLGFSDALNKMVGYLSFLSSENLSFIAGTSFFDRRLGKCRLFLRGWARRRAGDVHS